MNVRGAAVQSGLAALGLVVAYTTWQREPERAPGESIVVDVNKSDVQKGPFAVSDPYVKDEQDGRVYVLGGGVIGDLESAGVRFVDRQLHGFKPGDYDNVTISAGGKSRTLSVPAAENAFAAKMINPKTNKP